MSVAMPASTPACEAEAARGRVEERRGDAVPADGAPRVCAAMRARPLANVVQAQRTQRHAQRASPMR